MGTVKSVLLCSFLYQCPFNVNLYVFEKKKILRFGVTTRIRMESCSNNTFFNIEEKKHQNHYHNNKSDKQPMLGGRAQTSLTIYAVIRRHERQFTVRGRRWKKLIYFEVNSAFKQIVYWCIKVQLKDYIFCRVALSVCIENEFEVASLFFFVRRLIFCI